MKKKVYPYTRPNTTKVKDCHTPKQSDKAKVQKVGKWGYQSSEFKKARTNGTHTRTIYGIDTNWSGERKPSNRLRNCTTFIQYRCRSPRVQRLGHNMAGNSRHPLRGSGSPQTAQTHASRTSVSLYQVATSGSTITWAYFNRRVWCMNLFSATRFFWLSLLLLLLMFIHCVLDVQYLTHHMCWNAFLVSYYL